MHEKTRRFFYVSAGEIFMLGIKTTVPAGEYSGVSADGKAYVLAVRSLGIFCWRRYWCFCWHYCWCFWWWVVLGASAGRSIYVFVFGIGSF